jgi:hypothetical protein
MKPYLRPIAAVLIACSVPAAAQDADRQATEVFAAAADGDVRALTSFLDGGYDPNYRRGGRTALAHAVLSGRVDAVRLLLNRGADPRTTYHDPDIVGYDRPRSLIEIADATGKREIATLLRGGGNPKPGINETPANAPVATATAGKTKRTPVQARNIGASNWAHPTAFAAGDEILFTTSGGSEWRPGRILEAGSGEHVNLYLIEEPNGSRHYVDWNRVTSKTRQPYWTQFFVGDWDINTGIASNFRTDGRDVYHVVSGGMRLPPLRVNGDGSYQWSAGTKVVRGQWVAREDAPGITLLKGDKGADWKLVNSTTRSTHDTFKTDEIRLSSPVYSRVGHRIVRGASRKEAMLIE